MTPETLNLLRNMLAGVTLRVGAPDFVEVSTAAAQALTELDQALANTAKDSRR